MELLPPSTDFKDSFIEAVKEFHDDDDYTHRNQWYRHLAISELENSFESFVAKELNKDNEESIPKDRVPCSEYWLSDNGEFIGRVSIRHRLNDNLMRIGGHIGYDIRPSRRGKGYGNSLLAIAHDLVEAYAGDTWMYDEEALKTKQEREEKALQRIAKEFPEFADLQTYISAYGRREDAESTFVYALDKLIDELNVYIDGGRLWKERKTTLDKVLSVRAGKAKASPEVAPYLEALVKKIKEREAELFGPQ